jgi:hypothetical protein
MNLPRKIRPSIIWNMNKKSTVLCALLSEVSEKIILVEKGYLEHQATGQNLVPTWALDTILVPKAHVGTKFCNRFKD